MTTSSRKRCGRTIWWCRRDPCRRIWPAGARAASAPSTAPVTSWQSGVWASGGAGVRLRVGVPCHSSVKVGISHKAIYLWHTLSNQKLKLIVHASSSVNER
eukprot:3417375-Pleurochrysis_carterae.AAC.4